jgi:hypothetical protein
MGRQRINQSPTKSYLEIEEAEGGRERRRGREHRKWWD